MDGGAGEGLGRQCMASRLKVDKLCRVIENIHCTVLCNARYHKMENLKVFLELSIC